MILPEPKRGSGIACNPPGNPGCEVLKLDVEACLRGSRGSMAAALVATGYRVKVEVL